MTEYLNLMLITHDDYLSLSLISSSFTETSISGVASPTFLVIWSSQQAQFLIYQFSRNTCSLLIHFTGGHPDTLSLTPAHTFSSQRHPHSLLSHVQTVSEQHSTHLTTSQSISLCFYTHTISHTLMIFSIPSWHYIHLTQNQGGDCKASVPALGANLKSRSLPCQQWAWKWRIINFGALQVAIVIYICVCSTLMIYACTDLWLAVFSCFAPELPTINRKACCYV